MSAAAKAKQMSLPAAEFDLKAPHFGMWVGGRYYPTIEDFVNEAKNLGISKRIPKIPEDLVLGQSRIYFAHKQRAARVDADPVMRLLSESHRSRLLTICNKIVKNKITPDTIDAHPAIHKELNACVRCIREELKKKHPELHKEMQPGKIVKHGVEFARAGDREVVFGYTVISRIEFIVPQDGKIPEKIKKLAEEGHVKLVPFEKAAQEPDRGCGKRRPGGTYAVAYEIDEEAMKALRKDAKKVDLHGPLAVYRKPFKCWFGKFFRGIKKLVEETVRKTEMMGRLIGEEGDDD